MQILVTGCTGYIGSNLCVSLLNAGHKVIGINRFNHRNDFVLDNIHYLTGKNVLFYEATTLNTILLEEIFLKNDLDLVIDLASSKGIGPSLSKPLAYYHNNLGGALNLLSCMEEYHVHNIIFGSSSSVYGPQIVNPIDEFHPTNVTNPYGQSKIMLEKVLQDTYQSNPDWNIRIIRLFNPVSAHESGLLGESKERGVANILSYLSFKAINNEVFTINGHDYQTPDGTCLRDYIHVTDVANSFLKTINEMELHPHTFNIYNIGSGKGTSILELIHAFEKNVGISINYEFGPNRSTDLPIVIADTRKAQIDLDFSCTHYLDDMVRDAYTYERYQSIYQENIHKLIRKR